MSRSSFRACAALAACLPMLLTAGCSRGPQPGPAAPLATAPAPPVLPPSPGTTAAVARGLPDFTDLVATNGSAVVNVSVVERGRPAAVDDDGPDDPLHDFLKRFGGGLPRGQQPPARGEGSGFIVAGDGYILTNATWLPRRAK